jgi:hypothetical protein
MMLRNLAGIVLVAVLVAACGRWIVRRRARRRADELARHPERLDQMLDPTDDA